MDSPQGKITFVSNKKKKQDTRSPPITSAFMEKISGQVEHILPATHDTREIIAKLHVPYKHTVITVKGILPEPRIHDHLYLYGTWSKDQQLGEYFHIHSYEHPETHGNQGIVNYLTSHLIKGIGPKIAEKIITQFQHATSDILDYTPERLVEISGISQARCQKLCQQLHEQKELRKTLLFLQNYTIPIHYGIRLHNKYKEHTIDKVCEDPFMLTREMKGIGFKTADMIASRLGLPSNSKSRINTGILYSLEEVQEEGHTCYPLSLLIEKAGDLLNHTPTTQPISLEEITTQIHDLYQQHTLHIEALHHTPHVWLSYMHRIEQHIASDIKRILFSPRKIRSIYAAKAIEWVENNLSLNLEERQKDAVLASLSEKIHIITGGPGTGKSTITQAILNIFEKITYKIILAAPTGKAAKRMAEITRRHAVTIHALLQYDFKTQAFRKNHENPIHCDLMIIDEASMLDTFLLYSLLRALPDHAILIFIGDVYQLPSVGPGNVLKDFIQSETIAVTELHKVFRQVHNSNIITNAHRVNAGEFPTLHPESGRKDFLFFQKDDPQEALAHILHLITEFIPKKYHIYPQDIQVLAPMKKGILGIHNLNHSLKSVLNHNKSILHSKGYSYSVGDKVMQIHNNYQKEVFNGDIGYISSINFDKRTAIINIEGRYIPYSFGELDNLVLAYATSVHKYQGSESPCIIIPIHTSHFMMLYRNLLYTAITRGKQLVVLVGTKKAISIAVKNDKVLHRYTGLLQTLYQVNIPKKRPLLNRSE